MNEILHILLLEDNLADAELIEYELHESIPNFELKRVETEGAFLKELTEFAPDIILSDYKLPQYDFDSALHEARKRCPEVPIILVTGAPPTILSDEIPGLGKECFISKNSLQQLGPAIARVFAK